MDVLIKAAQLLVSLTIIVLVHELGHFVFAKLFKMRVDRFFIFFHPWFAIYRKKIGETEFGIGWLPLGGYAKIAGMIDESMDKDQMKKPPEPWEFRSKPSWQRFLVMVGGVLFNFITAIIIFASVLFAWGEQYLPTNNLKYGIAADSLAEEIGLRDGDKIVSLDGQEIENFRMVIHDLIVNRHETIQVRRNGEVKNIYVPDDIISELLESPNFITPRFPFIVGDFTDESVAKKAGLQPGDSIVGFNGMNLPFFDAFADSVTRHAGEEITLQFYRDGGKMERTLTLPESGKIGVYPVGDASRFFELETHDYSFFAAIPAGLTKGYQTLVSYLKQLKLILTPGTKAYKSVGSFIRIGSIFPGQWDWQSFWSLTALLSIILGIMNLLPIPALDGGHVLFILFEMITGRKPGDKFLEYAQIAGMIILLGLMILAFGNDLRNFVFNG